VVRHRYVLEAPGRAVRQRVNVATEAYRDDTPAPDLRGLAMRLATTPCGPLYSKHVSPDRELDALVRSITPPAN
jgi:hypothetical protein